MPGNRALTPTPWTPTWPEAAGRPCGVEVEHTRAVSWVTAQVWAEVGSGFRVEADLSEILAESGPGVYTVQIWGKAGEERVALTNYAIWVE